MEAVSLDDMDGFEFQRFVAHVFERLGLGKVEEIRQTMDSGRDIDIRLPDGSLAIVECKHHPNGTIGRPTVQKLHSAIITAQARKGFIVTTGTFSPLAIEYSQDLELPIELVDSRILYDMANRARIRVLREGDKTSIYHVMPPSDELVRRKMLTHLVDNALSHPHAPSQLVETKIEEIHFMPVYVLDYSLHENFSTTIGVVHSIHIDDGQILVNGENGECVSDRRFDRVLKLSNVAETPHSQQSRQLSYGRFKIEYSSVKKFALEYIQRRHTETIRYAGANNVRYSKTCIPHTSRIFIRDFKQVYLPILESSLTILTRHHQFFLCGNQSEVEILRTDAGNCEICGKQLKPKRLLCNSCGRLVHAPTFMGHSYYCKVCGKTICKECTYWTRNYLLFKKKLCEACAEKIENEGRKIKKLSARSSDSGSTAS